MKGILARKKRGLSPFFRTFLFVIVALLFSQPTADAAISYFASASNPSDNANLDLTVVPVTPPGSMQTGDLVVLIANVRESGETLAISNTGGQAWTTETANTTNATQRIFWARYNGSWSADPSVSFPGDTNGTTVVMHVFRPSASVNTWAVDVALTNSSFGDPSAPFDVTIAGITTVTDGALVVATWASTDDNRWGLQTAGWANAGGAQYRNLDGRDNSQSAAYKVMPTAGASGDVVNRQVTPGGSTWGGYDDGNSSILAFREVVPITTTTLGTGSDPAVNTIAPGTAATDVDLFTLQTSSGTEAITSVTVNLSTNNGVGRLAITDDLFAELGFTTSPVTGGNTISVASMSATTTLTSFRVRVTPLSHAAMPAPPGAAYAITAPVTAWAGPNAHAGSDTNPNALTIDNLSPAGAAAVSGVAGDAQVTLNWTTSASADFSRSVMLRWTGGAAGAEVPAEGTDYVNGNTITTATVVCVRTADAASTAVSGIDGAGTGGCSASALTNGQAYTYKIFQKDANGNYGTGVLVGTFTAGAMASGVINTYYPGTASVTAGATSITLGAATGAGTPIATGDLLIVMQMQDASIDSTNTAAYGTVSAANAGLYEYAIAGSNVPLGGGTLTLNASCGLTNGYTNANYVAGSSGQRRFQVIRVPVYASTTLDPALAALAWNGSTGGVLAFDATGALALNSATVTVDGKGFRGGASRTLVGPGAPGANTDYRTLASVNNNASKGEGIAGTPQYVFTAPGTLTNTAVEGYPNGSHARGAPANAGGGGTDLNPPINDQNPGGGGGANGGAGGIGGIGWCPGFDTGAPTYGCGLSGLVSPSNPGGSTGGIGGAAVTGLGATRLTLGGAGGGGTTNNGTGALAGGLSSSGAAGGGIIMVRAGSMTGSATFNANGSNGDSSVRNDGSGGGGAGGVVLISAGSGIGGATINVKGGKGGDNLVPPGSTATPHGPGGGGGGGYAITTGAPAASSAAAGANGVTYNGGVLFGAYGATAGSPGGSNTSLTAAAIPGAALGASSCAAPLNHLEIEHASGTGLTCAASTLTIKACADAAVPCVTPYTGGVSGTLSATGAPTVNWDGATGGAAGAGFVIPGGSSNVTKDVQVVTAGSVVFGVSSSTPTPANATTCNFGSPLCTFTASLAGFIFSDTTTGNTYTIPAQVSGIATPTLYLRAVQASTTNPAVCTPAIIGQTTAVSMGYVCNNPASCQPGNLTTINTTAIAPAGTAVNLAFDANGSAPITARYDDVGQITLNANKTVTPFSGATAIALNGSSNAFVVKPDHFDLSGIQQTAPPFLANPGAANAAGAKFVKAGENFTVTVTARNALGNATPNYGQETAPEGVKLTSALAGGLGLSNNPALGGAFGAFSGGVATATDVTWDEVGIITLTPSVGDANYLGAGDVSGTTSGNVGRFWAAKFDVVQNSPSFDAFCNSGATPFTYVGQPFNFAPAPLINLTARSLNNAQLNNYTGSWWKIPTTGWQGSYTAATGILDTTARPANDPAVVDAGGGTGTMTFSSGSGFYFTRTSPVAPFDADIGLSISVTDSDGAAYASNPVAFGAATAGNGIAFANGKTMRFGILRLDNAYGSELLSIRVPVRAMYWDGSSLQTNSADNCTSIPAGALVLGNYKGGLNASNMDATHLPVSATTLSSGTAAFTVTKPSPAAIGSVDLAINLGATSGDANCIGAGMTATGANLSWLRGNWAEPANCGGAPAYAQDPNARIKLGTPQAPYIYLRERY